MDMNMPGMGPMGGPSTAKMQHAFVMLGTKSHPTPR